MNENLKAFGDLAREDKDLEASVRAAAEAGDVSKLIELAKQHGIEVTEEDFTLIEMSELDDEELEAVAGGTKCDTNAQAFLCGFVLFTDLWCPDGVQGM